MSEKEKFKFEIILIAKQKNHMRLNKMRLRGRELSRYALRLESTFFILLCPLNIRITAVSFQIRITASI